MNQKGQRYYCESEGSGLLLCIKRGRGITVNQKGKGYYCL